VFLHHGLGSVSLWRDFPARLAAATGLPALVYDRCGHGKSPPCEQPRQPDYLHREARVLASLLEVHEARNPILIGHSDGGSIAFLYAALPDVPAPLGIISEAAHLFVEDVTRAGIRATVDSYRAGLRDRLLRHHGGNTDRLFWNWAGGWLSPRFDSFDVREHVAAVRCPVMAIQGLEDEYGTLAQVEAIEGSVNGPVERVLIPGCAHEPHSQAPDATFAAMVRAISSWRPAALAAGGRPVHSPDRSS
jgi:pimeloyl-ACP methyl ester carboxylesterase